MDGVSHFGFRYHKVHHEYTSPVALCTMYAHPLEILLNNMVPIALGPLLLSSHLVTAWIWFVICKSRFFCWLYTHTNTNTEFCDSIIGLYDASLWIPISLDAAI